MIRYIQDKTYNFLSIFNDETGEYIRGIGVKAEYPHLIDVGIMGHCEHGRSGLCLKAGIKCYQNGLSQICPNMTLENYKRIINESRGRLFEIALGGRGDPDMHENFEDILKYSRENGVVPNFTTSGLGMTNEKAEICKKYCGAVAVSCYSRLSKDNPVLVYRIVDGKAEKEYKTADDIPVVFCFGSVFDYCKYDFNNKKYIIDGYEYTPVFTDFIDFIDNIPVLSEDKHFEFRFVKHEERDLQKNPHNYTYSAVKMLMDAGVKTNIHFVVSNSTIDEAIYRVKHNGFPKGINAIVFLLHKPVGLGDKEDVLSVKDPRVQEFFELVDKGNYPYKIGFDSCSIPGVLKWGKHIDTRSIDTCEGSRFSMYIDADMIALPCSFDNQDKKFAVDLKDGTTIKDAWDSETFEKFRNSLRHSCSGCPNRELCMGGCPLQNSIVLCDSEKRDFVGE